MCDDKKLIEDYLPIVAISAEASREKSVRKGHISTLHLWWARRPLVASDCLSVVLDSLANSDPQPLIILNPGKRLDHPKPEAIAARHYDISADAIESAAQKQT